MSAALASMAILGLALAGGFAWWERSRPPARMVALVATLAALAAIGRIAFAPLPNVKPTTDIVLFAGFALGAAPGFAVGAVAALSSNFFFGQGPWTPWQMAAWGLVGLLGAGLGRVLRRPGRVPLALACGFAGLLFGELLNASLWVNYSDHSLGALLGYMGRGVPFDLAHVIGNVVFCLAFGPALVSALRRFETRMSVRWVPVAAAVLMALAVAPLAVAAPAGSAAPGRYLAGAQNSDGGFGGGAGERSSSLYTGWAALGLEALGRHPADVRRPGGKSLLDYLRAHTGDLSDLGAVSRTILVVAPAGQRARSFGGRDLVGALLAGQGRDGSFQGRVNTTSFAVLALRAAGVPRGSAPVRRAVRWLTKQANRDGGFNFAGRGGGSGIDDTSAPLQALAAAGRGGSKAARRAARFLARRQNPDGGFPLSPGGASNAQSTAWSVQGLVAAGRDPDRVRRRGSRSPIAYLRSLTTGGGAVRYSATSAQTPVWVTAQALTALARQPFPLARVTRRVSAPARRAAPRSRPATPSARDRRPPAKRARHRGTKQAKPRRRGSAGMPQISERRLERIAHQAGMTLGAATALL